jgi:hemerythrin superfamily protein
MPSTSRRNLLLSCAFGASLALASSGTAHASPVRRYIDVCPKNGPRRCDTKVVTDEAGLPLRSTAAPVGGWSPADLQSAYGLPAAGGSGLTVAVFGGGSDLSDAESDLAVYRSQYGLPPCTSASGCFRKIDEHGGTSYPPPGTSSGDELEQMLDLEMASAGCPACKILFVVGPDLDVALATVKSSGAAAFSFSFQYSYGSDATNASVCQSAGFDDTSSGLLVTGAMGDGGYPSLAGWVPVVCQGVVAVGGTSLTRDSSARGWSETTWSGTGSGCSDAVAKPSWQTDTGCSMRMAGDISAVGDPSTGVSVYSTQGGGGWIVVGGTSASSPLVAGALTAVGVANGHFTPAWIWQHTADFYDVTTGSNGSCGGQASYVCKAGPGYDGPTGWGTPNGKLLASEAGGGAYAAQFVGQSFPLAVNTTMTMAAGQVIPSYIELKNVGTKTWDSNTRLATSQPRDRGSAFADGTWIAPNRLAAVQGTVPPGGTYRFTFDLAAPPAAGAYDEFFGVVEEGAAWFSDPGQGGPTDDYLEVRVSVVAAPADAGGPIDASVPTDAAAARDAAAPIDAAPPVSADGGLWAAGDGAGASTGCGCEAAGATQAFPFAWAWLGLGLGLGGRAIVRALGSAQSLRVPPRVGQGIIQAARTRPAVNDATRCLETDHQRLDALLLEIEQAASAGQFPHAQQKLSLFASGLLRHMRAEEDILFPLLQSADARTGTPISVMRMDHDNFRELLALVAAQFTASSKLWASSLGRLREGLAAHNVREERVLYPMAGDVAQATGRTAELADRLRTVLEEPRS